MIADRVHWSKCQNALNLILFRVEKAGMGSLVAASFRELMCESLEGDTVDYAPKRVLSYYYYYFKTKHKHSNWATSEIQKCPRRFWIHNRAVSVFTQASSSSCDPKV